MAQFYRKFLGETYPNWRISLLIAGVWARFSGVAVRQMLRQASRNGYEPSSRRPDVDPVPHCAVSRRLRAPTRCSRMSPLCRLAFDGEVVNFSPLHSSKHRFPKQLFGFTKSGKSSGSRAGAKSIIFFLVALCLSDPSPLAQPDLLYGNREPDLKRKPPASALLQGLERIIVSSERDAAVLRAWGLTNYAIVPPAWILAALRRLRSRSSANLVLLMASAPWNRRQFNSKGIDLLLATAAALPFLRRSC